VNDMHVRVSDGVCVCVWACVCVNVCVCVCVRRACVCVFFLCMRTGDEEGETNDIYSCA
jgi:hypothetical protein